MKKRSILAVILALVMSFACLTGCGQKEVADNGIEIASGGILSLRVNPEIDIFYDADGNVYKLEAKNPEAKEILKDYTGYEGKTAKAVVTDLVSRIGEAGYFVEEIEGEKRQITIEIEKGSVLPNDTFLDEVIAEVKACVNSNHWDNPLNVQGESDFGITDYVDTDYGVGNDGVTDYDDTDYGPNNDGVTDYNDTDYGANNDGVTDYHDGKTDYDNGRTDYHDGRTDYDD